MSGYKFEIIKGTDTITVEVLEDGTIRTETDKISSANHGTADNFLKEMFRLACGRTEIKFKRPVAVVEGDHAHHHSH